MTLSLNSLMKFVNVQEVWALRWYWYNLHYSQYIKLGVCLFILLYSQFLAAGDIGRVAGVYLVDAQQDEIRIGTVTFSSKSAVESDSTAIAFELDDSVFSDHFLSMRPFRCLTGEKEWFCYLKYPYDLRSIISSDDLTDLEYQLLFIRKKPSEFGIDAWNGLYYKLRLEEDGSMTGELLEGDLNSLQSPPSEKYAKPVDLGEFIPADVNARLYPVIRIY